MVLTVSQGDWSILVSKPIALAVLILAALIVTLPLWRRIPGRIRDRIRSKELAK